jgi:hypothetical protein
MRNRRVPLVAASGLALAALLVAVLASSASGRAQVKPSNTNEPSISGVPLVGNTLTLARGTWSGTPPITYTYQWQRCDPNGGSCNAIGGATQTTYELTSSDVGNTIRVRVTAKNADGSENASSDPTGTVSTKNGGPANSKAPTISGSAVVGNDLTAAVGTWVGDTPLTYSYQWVHCDNQGNACANIAGASKSTYNVVQANVGDTIRVKVSATNSKGDASAFSDQTAVVQDASGGGGIITLPDGTKSVAVADIPKGERLIVDTVQFDPNPVTSRSTPIQVKIRIKDTRNYVVRGAYVFLRSTPIVSSTPTDAQTANDGTITYSVQPRSDFPIKTGYSVQFYVKAYRKGDPTLAGIAGYRLVQVATKKV